LFVTASHKTILTIKGGGGRQKKKITKSDFQKTGNAEIEVA